MTVALRPAAGAPRVAWAPQPGSQTLFVTCPFREAIATGTRGSAKTDGLLMDFAQEVGKGFGPAWRGIVFRRTYKQLDDIVVRSKRWFRSVFPGARFYAGADVYKWVFRTGEELLFRHFYDVGDYENYHGHEYPWIGWEELTVWPDLAGYHLMKSTNRCSLPGVPLRYRGTTNPYGVGHNAVKAYIVDPAPSGTPIRGEDGWTRIRIRCHYSENRALMAADPDYPETIRAAAGGDPHITRAWLHEDWDIVAGGLFDDVWDRAVHVLDPFPIPTSWRIDRAFDWGSAKPFSVGWWAESDGTPATLADGTTRHFPRGTLIRIAEWYGCTGRPNEGLRMVDGEIARGILRREQELGLAGRVQLGPADASIFDEENGDSPAKIQERAGVRWHRADKSPGSRVRRWKVLRQRLDAAKRRSREEPGLYVVATCRDWLRTVPVAPRHDRKIDDIADEYEDHAADETGYRLLEPARDWRVSTMRV